MYITMNIRNTIFIILLLTPSVMVFLLNSVEKTNIVDALLSVNDLLGITLLPFLGALILKKRISFLLAASIPILFIFTKSFFYDGAERLIATGTIVFLAISVISWALGFTIKHLYQKHLTRH